MNNYFETHALSRSVLNTFRHDPEKALAMWRGEYEYKTSNSMSFGIAFEVMLLETPQAFKERFVITSANDWRKLRRETSSIRQSGMMPIKPIDFELCHHLVGLMREFKLFGSTVGNLLDNGFNSQVMIDGDVEGIKCKGLIDLEFPDIPTFLDIKTSWDVRDARGFNEAGFKYGYDIQSALYSMLYKHPNINMGFLVVTTTKPYEIRIFYYKSLSAIVNNTKKLIKEFVEFIDLQGKI